MKIVTLSAALMAAGLLIAAPAFAQSSTMPGTQETGTPPQATPGSAPASANSTADQKLKQQTQEGGQTGRTCNHSNNADPGANPDCTQLRN